MYSGQWLEAGVNVKIDEAPTAFRNLLILFVVN
jgi:hypothetical protein